MGLITRAFQFRRSSKLVLLALGIVHAVMIDLFLLGQLGISFPLVQTAVGYIYLAIIPGFLILWLIGLKDLSRPEMLLYSVGLSLSFDMLYGFAINQIYPLIGVIKPLSQVSISVSFIVAISLLFLLVLIFGDKSSNVFDLSSLRGLLSPIYCACYIIPFIAFLGTQFVNNYNTNFLCIALILYIVAIFIFFTQFDNLPQHVFPVAIFCVSVALVWHITLISDYIVVLDVIGEYYVANLTISENLWDISQTGSYYSVLSVTILPALFCNICGTELTYYFKYLYPLLYATTAIGVYELSKYILQDTRLSFVSAFLFIVTTPFFREVSLISKQGIAEIFLICIILAFVKADRFRKAWRSVIVIFLGAALICSHYGIAYLFLFFLASYSILLFVSDNFYRASANQNRLYLNKITRFIKPYIASFQPSQYIIYYTLFFFIFSISWYFLVSGSSTFELIIRLGEFAIQNAYNELLNPDSSRGLYLISKEIGSILHNLSRAMYILIQIIIVIGLVVTIIQKKLKRNAFYLLISLYFVFLLMISLMHTSLSAMDPRRLFHLSLLVLSPYAVEGFKYIILGILGEVKISNADRGFKIFKIALVSFVALFFLFNVGLIYEMTNDDPTSISLSQQSIINSSNAQLKANFFGSVISPQNVFSGAWVVNEMVNEERIYRGDWVEGYPSLTIYGGLKGDDCLNTIYAPDGGQIKSFNSLSSITNGYVQLSSLNIIFGLGSEWDNTLQKRTVFNFSEVESKLIEKQLVYSNGFSRILYGG